MRRTESSILINAGVRGLAAVALIQVANSFLPTIMTNQFMSWGFYGITVGTILAAGIGVYAADQLLLQ